MAHQREEVMTVLGPVAAEELGVTITHEHLLIDMTCYFQAPVEATLKEFVEAPVEIQNLGKIRRNPLMNRDNCLLTDLDLAIDEIMEFRKLGGETIVDVTLPDIGRDPVALQIASRMSGLNIVAGCGHYVHLAHPTSLEEESVESIAERLIRELTEGIGETGVRPGVIGEIGTSDPIRSREEKVLRAAAQAQQATGVAVTVHLHPASRNGHDVLGILESAGADLSRVIMDHLDISLGHLDIGLDDAVAYHSTIAERGCYLEYDTCGNDAYFASSGYGGAFWCPSDRERAKAIAMLIDAGYGERILLSQDVCHKYHLVRFGGFGYGHVLRSFLQNLRDAGVGDPEIQRMLVGNPRRILVPAK
jgi:phosphotriesterase-related protein